MRPPTEQDQIDLRMLEYMYDSGDDRAADVGIGDLITHYGHDNEGRDWLASAQRRDLIRGNQRNYPSYRLTEAGRRLVQETRQRRNDPGYRRRVLQQRVLAYVDSKCPTVGSPMAFPSKIPDSEYGVLDGVRFTEGEVDEAVDFLVDRELLKSVGKTSQGWARAGISHNGRECATDFHYDVAAYLAAQRQTSPSIQVSGEGNALSVALGHNSTATATATTINVEAALTLAQAIREALPVLGLGEDAEAAVDDIEAKDDEDRMRRGLRWFGRFADNTSASALGQLLGTAALTLAGGA